ncbi:hypothetical protein LIER_25627 [Lithospermum erythrorhizon]|uniref:Secreted protein n=1 Tax=Lithospermum erythrorhizon TaxID=34254 RepID=A0AAV3R5J5_LITER
MEEFHCIRHFFICFLLFYLSACCIGLSFVCLATPSPLGLLWHSPFARYSHDSLTAKTSEALILLDSLQINLIQFIVRYLKNRLFSTFNLNRTGPVISV